MSAVGVLLVDVANVVGARPDGWWRDRAGAASRLLDRLAPLVGTTFPGPGGAAFACEHVVAVLEGQARDVPAPARVRVVRAPGSGDDALTAKAAALDADGRTVLAVTADRGLRARLPATVGAAGPGWLLARLDELTATD
jgi:hypothetical protein